MNRLAGETSPYLLQHAATPVDWYPWGDEALVRAREEDRPILLSIGYSACHWCHVMEHESFEDRHTAELMNRLFVNIKVDREERPDLDAVYMNAVVTLTGRGGWPMTVFLTPEGRPFYGGTYYPPEPRFGMPAFRQVLEAVAAAYRDRRAEVDEAAGRLTQQLQGAAALVPSPEPLTESLLTEALPALSAAFDPRWGGFGGAPKFPPASTIELLLRLHRRSGAREALEMAATTLDGMAQGGMYDVLGGGFHRYSVDERWLIPHFEKMLYDNALLASAYLHSWVVTGNERHRQVVEETLGYLLGEMRLAEGVFASAQDADTAGVEGLTYVWTPEQIREVLEPADADAAIAHYGVTDHGNFEGATALRPSGQAPEGIERIRAALLAARRSRPQPARDDKALACWNGLALSALAEAGWRLGRPDLLAAARDCADFLLSGMSESGRLLRTYRDGRAKIAGYLDDYGAVANGLLDLYTATGEERYLAECERLTRLAVELFGDRSNGGFFFTPADGERLVAPHKELDDNPTPSGQSLLATVLLKLARLRGEPELEGLAAGVLRLAVPYMERAPQALGQALCALDMYLSAPVEVAVVGPPGDPRTRAMADAARSGFHPNAVYAFGDGTSPSGVPLLDGKALVEGRPAVYVCERFACRTPVTDPSLVEVP
ncbi:MAG: thioredoxin domain-containing protein [Gaiellales bacterium]